jgi:hypothetical protein
VGFRRKVVDAFDGRSAEGWSEAEARSAVMSQFNVTSTQVNAWRVCPHVLSLIQTRGANAQRERITAPAVGQFPDCEDVLYQLFYFAREYEGHRIRRRWLRRKMLGILAELRPEGWQAFKASEGWCTGFCRRYAITSQSRTNGKVLPIRDRIPRIQAFHRAWLATQNGGYQRDPIYGRFPPSHLFHHDQVPLSFSPGATSTLHMRGANRCWVRSSGSGQDKRMATLQLCICADPHSQVVRPTIVLRGKGLRLTNEELEYYEGLADRIRVMWQNNAWTDGATIHLWLLEEFFPGTLHLDGDVCLAGDNHSSQRVAYVMEAMEAVATHGEFTPPECTDVVSPVDHHVGRYMQRFMHDCYEQFMEVEGRWLDEEDNMPVKERRMLIVGWALQAWESLCADHTDLLEAAFVSTGFKMAKDGSEVGLVRLEGWDRPYQLEPYPDLDYGSNSD